MTFTNSPAISPELKFTVGNNTFISKAWPTRSKAFKNFPIIGKAFAVPLSFLFNAGQTGNIGEAIPQALFMLFEQLEQDDSDLLLDTILADVFIFKDGGYTPVNVDEHLSDIDQLFELLSKVLTQHYGKVLSGKGFGSLINILVPMTQAATQA